MQQQPLFRSTTDTSGLSFTKSVIFPDGTRVSVTLRREERYSTESVLNHCTKSSLCKYVAEFSTTDRTIDHWVLIKALFTYRPKDVPFIQKWLGDLERDMHYLAILANIVNKPYIYLQSDYYKLFEELRKQPAGRWFIRLSETYRYCLVLCLVQSNGDIASYKILARPHRDGTVEYSTVGGDEIRTRDLEQLLDTMINLDDACEVWFYGSDVMYKK